MSIESSKTRHNYNKINKTLSSINSVTLKLHRNSSIIIEINELKLSSLDKILSS